MNFAAMQNAMLGPAAREGRLEARQWHVLRQWRRLVREMLARVGIVVVVRAISYVEDDEPEWA